jgi:hypothetical protein
MEDAVSRSFIVRAIVPAVAAISLLGQPAWAAGSACWSPDEIPAARLHAFHTMLMVGAMRCRNERPDALGSYEAFFEARKGSLQATRTVLQAHFIRALGPESGPAAYTDYDTKIGNQISNLDHNALRCEMIGTYARLAATASEGDLYTLARVSDTHVDVLACDQQTAVVPPAGLESAVIRKEAEPAMPAAEPASTELPQTEPMDKAVLAQAEPQATAAPPEPAAMPAEPEAKPVEPSATQTASVEEARVDPAAALEDAARALAAAAVSLRERQQ